MNVIGSVVEYSWLVSPLRITVRTPTHTFQNYSTHAQRSRVTFEPAFVGVAATVSMAALRVLALPGRFLSFPARQLACVARRAYSVTPYSSHSGKSPFGFMPNCVFGTLSYHSFSPPISLPSPPLPSPPLPSPPISLSPYQLRCQLEEGSLFSLSLSLLGARLVTLSSDHTYRL